MDLKISGKVTDLLEEQSGEGRNGPWRKQDFILETGGAYPKTVCITQWGDDIESFGLSLGDEVTVHIDLKSREYQGRWYTDVKAWKVAREGAEGTSRRGPSPAGPRTGGPTPMELPEDDDDDILPF